MIPRLDPQLYPAAYAAYIDSLEVLGAELAKENEKFDRLVAYAISSLRAGKYAPEFIDAAFHGMIKQILAH